MLQDIRIQETNLFGFGSFKLLFLGFRKILIHPKIYFFSLSIYIYYLFIALLHTYIYIVPRID